ncbi:peptide ABC transporter substrate-binding protein [Aquamicrobium sp. LC103]|uniref:peptide ABC transporter substrate-binding protein n=1 Tax=Aquamicrobium sp. LC103 TaxID=1120658 RepID=UPI00063E7A4B|nr:peptide ABC transporter substrate-binding protein [Aquamicrobium sp. LC103]TKT78230.1 peptide ABC transporter substrate-binding protein [Aquamicrobium sp. LC103]
MSTKLALTRRSLLKGAAATGFLLPATGLYRPAIAQSNPDRVIFATTQEPVQFNPLLYANGGTDTIPEALVFDALWDVDEKGDFIPNLAARIPTRENGDISEDGRTWRVNLKPGVTWSDGQPFTAKDVEFTYQTIVNPSVAARSRSGFDLIDGIKIVDDHTVEITLKRAYVPFYWAWQSMHIVPHHLLSGESDINTSGFNAQPIGTGAYILQSRTAGSHMIYEANPNYHRGAPKIKQFIHKFVPDQLVAYGQMRTGEIDYFGLVGIPYDRWEEARGLPGRTFQLNPQPYVQFIYFNTEKPQFTDPKVRKALYIACEMEKSIQDINFGSTPRTLSYLHPSHWAYNGALKEETANPQLAEKMLDEAGWRRGADGIREKDGVKMKFTMSTTAGVPSRQASQQLFQQNWKDIGVDMEIRNMPGSVVWGDYTTKSQFDTLLVAWEPPVGMDPDYSARCHSNAIGNGANYTLYKNPEVDRLLDLGATQENVEERKQTYAKVQDILLEEVPFAPQFGVVQGNMTVSALQGIKPNQYVTDAAWNVHEWSWA